MHFCSTEKGPSGSSILNLSNNKIIGIHKQCSLIDDYNIGAFLYESIKEFIQRYNKNKKEKNSNIEISNNKGRSCLLWKKLNYLIIKK